MKKLMAAVLAGLMLAGLLSGCANTANDDEVEYRWKMALNSTEGDNAYDTGVLFAQKIKELTDGRVQVDLYGGAQLGTTAEVLEGMYAGVADVMCESIGTLATFTPLANIEAMPYMFSSYDHFMNVWYSDLGQEIKDAVGDDAGFKLMGASYRGPRVVCATKELKTVADFKGFKLRAPNLEMYLKTWQWAGANPTPIPMNEVYTALQTNTIDGQENPADVPYSSSFYEVQKYISATNHIAEAWVVGMNPDKFASLDEDLQTLIAETAQEMQQWKLDYDNATDQADIDFMVEKGMEYNELDEAGFAAFQEVSKSLYPEFQKIVDNDDLWNSTIEFAANH